MMRVDVTPEEIAMLREILTIYLSDFRREVAGTENPSFRAELTRRQVLLEKLVERLPSEAAPGAA